MGVVQRPHIGWVASLVAALLVVGCASATDSDREAVQGPPSIPSVTQGERLESLLLLLEDRRQEDALTLAQALEGSAQLRRRLAEILGRVGGERSPGLLSEVLLDPDPTVRRAAAFSWAWLAGQGVDLGESVPELLAVVDDPDPGVGAWAVEALASAGVELSVVTAPFDQTGDESELWRRLLPSLHRFATEDGVPAARLALERLPQLDLPAPEVAGLRRRALGVWLGRGTPSVEEIASGLADADPWARVLVLEALGRSEDGSTLGRLEGHLLPEAVDVEADAVAATAWRSADALLSAGRAAPPETWRRTLRAAIALPHASTRVAAQSAARHWLPDEELSRGLAERARAGDAAALLELARAGDGRALTLVYESLADPAVERARLAVRAAAILDRAELLEEARRDPRGPVRAVALSALLRRPGARRLELLQEALTDASPSVRVVAYEALAEDPLLSLEPLLVGLEGVGRGDVEVQLRAVDALARLAAERVTERGGAIAALEGLAERTEWAVRRRAAAALVELGRPRPAIGSAGPRRPPDWYRSVSSRTGEEAVLRLETARGVVRLRLDCASAALSCLSFLQLAAQGFYDGLALYEVADAVATGDPRGDGLGDPGYRLRDEPTARRFDRPGILVLERSSPDACGSRFLLTRRPRPQLEARSVAIGEVISGLDVLARLGPGDRVLRLRAEEAGRRSVGDAPSPPR